MNQLITIRTPEEMETWSDLPDLPTFNPEDLIRDASDSHWILVGDDGMVEARCSLWWRGTPKYPLHHVGIIGHYFAGSKSAARRIIRHACTQLAAKGCTLAVGPMDGSTWRRYRLIVERGNEPVFFMEPDNPDNWPEHFTDNAFKPLAYYFSAVNSDLSRQNPRVDRIARKMAAQGITIRMADPDNFEQELRNIYRISIRSFSSNLLYHPISEADFMTQYQTIKPYFQPELVLIAEQEGHATGFIFAAPDMNEQRRGHLSRNTVVIKSMAVLPERANAGLGGLLLARCHESARCLGYNRAIHALMHENNHSRNISRRYAQTIRRYALFAKVIGKQK